MGHQMSIRNRLASLLDEVAVHEGPQRTLVEGVEVSRGRIRRPARRWSTSRTS